MQTDFCSPTTSNLRIVAAPVLSWSPGLVWWRPAREMTKSTRVQAVVDRTDHLVAVCSCLRARLKEQAFIVLRQLQRVSVLELWINIVICLLKLVCIKLHSRTVAKSQPITALLCTGPQFVFLHYCGIQCLATLQSITMKTLWGVQYMLCNGDITHRNIQVQKCQMNQPMK